MTLTTHCVQDDHRIWTQFDYCTLQFWDWTCIVALSASVVHYSYLDAVCWLTGDVQVWQCLYYAMVSPLIVKQWMIVPKGALTTPLVVCLVPVELAYTPHWTIVAYRKFWHRIQCWQYIIDVCRTLPKIYANVWLLNIWSSLFHKSCLRFFGLAVVRCWDSWTVAVLTVLLFVGESGSASGMRRQAAVLTFLEYVCVAWTDAMPTVIWCAPLWVNPLFVVDLSTFLHIQASNMIANVHIVVTRL